MRFGMQPLEQRQFLSASLSTTGTLTYAPQQIYPTSTAQADDVVDVRRVNDDSAFADQVVARDGWTYIYIVEPGGMEKLQLSVPNATRDNVFGALANDLGGGEPLVYIERPVVHTLNNGTVLSGTEYFVVHADDVKRLNIDGGSGDDTISINKNVKLPTTLIGGSGNDTLLGGTKLDHLSGGSGDDTLTARGTGAVLEGGQGNDTILGSSTASDSLYGGAGRDNLDGGDLTPVVNPPVEGRKSPFGNGGASPTPIVPVIPTIPTVPATPVAINGIRDYLDGGEDIDTAKRDNNDVRVSIEVLT
jgi:Ca2+-binding RTX toxin-like protein